MELTHVFSPKMAIFPTFSFSALYSRKIFFTIFQNEKPPFQAIKTRRSKSRKIEIFPKGLTLGFGQKIAIFPAFFFRQYRPEKYVQRHSRTKKTILNAIKTRTSNCPKIKIFPNGLTHGFGQKINIFPFFFQLMQGRKMFYDILELKKRLSRLKKNMFKKSKNKDFSKGVNPWFWS